MGWLWTTPSSAPAQANTSSTSSQSISDPSAASATPKSRSQDELADRELRSFLQEIEADIAPSSTKYNRIPKQPPPPGASSQSEEPISEQLLPRTMSCRDAFDAAFYCNSMGGQFNNLYRYGTVRACSENWNDFWFCMRTRTFGSKQKEEAIRARYREKERVKYGTERGGDIASEDAGRSSEDVWRSRRRKLEWGEAFNEPFPSFEGSDEEWNIKERERRRRMAEMQARKL